MIHTVRIYEGLKSSNKYTRLCRSGPLLLLQYSYYPNQPLSTLYKVQDEDLFSQHSIELVPAERDTREH